MVIITNVLPFKGRLYVIPETKVLTQWSKKTNTGFIVLKTENYMYFRFSDVPACLALFLLNVIPIFFVGIGKN